MDSLRNSEDVRDVFRTSDSGARGRESGVVQASKGPIPILTREEVLTPGSLQACPSRVGGGVEAL